MKKNFIEEHFNVEHLTVRKVYRQKGGSPPLGFAGFQREVFPQPLSYIDLEPLELKGMLLALPRLGRVK